MAEEPKIVNVGLANNAITYKAKFIQYLRKPWCRPDPSGLPHNVVRFQSYANVPDCRIFRDFG